jgi:hypothetical protein
MDTMTPQEIGNAVLGGTMTPAEGIVALKEQHGYDDNFAREQIFIACGGDDVITTNANNQPIYARSGKTVKEVQDLLS